MASLIPSSVEQRLSEMLESILAARLALTTTPNGDMMNLVISRLNSIQDSIRAIPAQIFYSLLSTAQIYGGRHNSGEKDRFVKCINYIHEFTMQFDMIQPEIVRSPAFSVLSAARRDHIEKHMDMITKLTTLPVH